MGYGESIVGGYGADIIGASPSPAAHAARWTRIQNALSKGRLSYEFTRTPNGYRCSIELPLENGRIIRCTGACTLEQAAAELGYTVGQIYEVGDALHALGGGPEDFECAGFDAMEVGNIFEDIGHGISSAAKFVGHGAVSVGKFIQKAAKSKAFKSALHAVSSVISNPVVIAGLGVVTGGAALPALAAANTAMAITTAATKAIPGSPTHKASRKLARASMLIADRESGKKPIPKGAKLQTKGFAAGSRMTDAQAAKLEKLKQQVVVAVKQRAASHRAELASRGFKHVAAVLPKPAPKDVARYMVAISKATALA
jgi:hypothetical protein